MKVIFFAQSREAAGCAECHLEVERPVVVEELWDRLVQKFSGLAALRPTARLARGQVYLAPDAVLAPQEEVAVIPAVSGG
jgi:molybdopterin converting factor small subunit